MGCRLTKFRYTFAEVVFTKKLSEGMTLGTSVIFAMYC